MENGEEHIELLKRKCMEAERRIEVLSRECERKEREISLLTKEARQKDDVIVSLKNECAVRRELIEKYHTRLASITLSGVSTSDGAAIRRLAQKAVLNYVCRGKVRVWLWPRLGKLCHHDPIPLKTPRRYLTGRIPSDPPKISIVTPSLNQSRHLEQTIRSVLQQNYPRLQYVVQDGCSIDGSVEILKRYEGKLFKWQSAPDRGQAHGINRGFRNTDGEIMAYLNADDILLPGALNYVANFFHSHPKVDVVYGHRVMIDENGSEIGRWVLPPHHDETLRWADYIPQETLFWRRQVWEKAGGTVDESFQFAMDWDLILRFLDSGAKFFRLPRFLGAFRVYPLQKTSSAIDGTGAREMAVLRQRCHGRPVSDEEAWLNVRGYAMRHVLYRILYDLRLARY